MLIATKLALMSGVAAVAMGGPTVLDSQGARDAAAAAQAQSSQTVLQAGPVAHESSRCQSGCNIWQLIDLAR